MVEVLDRDLRVLHRARSRYMVDWICDHPLECESVSIEGLMDLLSIDEYMQRYENLDEEF
jgi:hypothetical protein